jgi:hypothetical protein
MAIKLDPSEIVPFKERLLSNSIQIDTAFQVMIEKMIDQSLCRLKQNT